MIGSPPPMRGKVQPLVDGCMQARITPAYAGKRWRKIKMEVLRQDHPRLCGEKVDICSMCPKVPGSPPPMRGKVLYSDWAAAGYGITPAYAGKRRYPRRLWRNFWDHPRLCGEKKAKIMKARLMIGSPPPMRGKAMFDASIVIGQGITPAYAGKRFVDLCSCFIFLDHPRLCGEKRVELGSDVNR